MKRLQKGASEKGAESSAKKRILVVDDEPHIVELVKVTLEGEYFDVIQAYNGSEALKIAEESVPDLVLLDVQMPNMDGYEVCQKLRNARPTQGVPILILTSRGGSVDREKGKASGADAYLTKPFSPLKLLAVVKEQLRI